MSKFSTIHEFKMKIFNFLESHQYYDIVKTE